MSEVIKVTQHLIGGHTFIVKNPEKIVFWKMMCDYGNSRRLYTSFSYVTVSV